MQELFNYFSQSSLRNVKYKRAFELINTGVDSIKYRKLVQLSDTRWLAYGAAVKRVIEQWIELKYHFSIIATAENEKKAKNIYLEMCDDRNRLFLIFINPIINDINGLNLDFQCDTVDAGSLYDKMLLTFLSLCAKIFKPAVLKTIQNMKNINDVDSLFDDQNSLLPLNAVDFGSGA